MKTDIWVRPGMAAGEINGSGTEVDPYWGDLDKIVRLAWGQTIRLLEGQYAMRGVWESNGEQPNVTYGSRIIGAGMHKTIINQIEFDNTHNSSLFYGWGADCVGVEIRDMTLDLRGDGDDIKKRMGIVLKGDRCSIDRVRVINASGNHAHGEENFTLYVGQPGTEHCAIRHCIVEMMHGDYCNGLAIGGGEAILEGNTILMPRVTGEMVKDKIAGNNCCINLISVRRAVIANNVLYGGNRSIYHDTGEVVDLKILNNSFVDCWCGIYFEQSDSSGCSDVIVNGNSFELNAEVDYAAGRPGLAMSFWNKGPVAWKRLTARGNIVKLADGGAGKVRWFQAAGIINGVFLWHNIIPDGSETRLTATVTGRVLDNWTHSAQMAPAPIA